MLRGLACASLVFLGIAGTAAADCSARAMPEIVVSAKEMPARWDQEQSHAELSMRSVGLGPTLGATETQHETDIAFAMLGVPMGKQVCVTFRKITLKLTLSSQVHLASELKPGSCLYKAVARHEQQHVDLDRKMLPTARLRVEAAIAGVARQGALAPTGESASELLQDKVWEAVDRALDGFVVERNRGQAVFDTPEECLKLGQECSDDEKRALFR